MSIAPSEFPETLTIANVDLTKAITKYEDNPKNFIAMGLFRDGKKSFKTSLVGELSTNGLYASEFGKKTSYSFGISLSEEDLEAIQKLNDTIESFINDDTWEIVNIIKDDKIYIKLKPNTKNNAFMVISNVKLNPLKFQESGLFRGQRVDVTCELGVYFNIPEKKAGITISARRLEFEVESEEPAAKKMKK
jgi:hypothetical protein